MRTGTTSRRARPLAGALLALCASACAPAAPRPEAPPIALRSPEVVARSVVDAMARDDDAGARADLDFAMQEALSPSALHALWASFVARYGALVAIDSVHAGRPSDEAIAVHVVVRFARANVDLKLVVDGETRHVAGLWIDAVRTNEPARAEPVAPGEEPVWVGTAWRLAGTLAMPAAAMEKGGALVPGVVLVHGSGPMDRDETVEANKPFRDLSAGLSSRGVAVLRYEKRTRTYGARWASDPTQWNADSEVVLDACAAVLVLAADPRIDARRITVVGHSLGAMLLPRIAERCGARVASLVGLATPARPLEDLMIAQLEYLRSLPVSRVSPSMLAAAKGEAARIKTLRDGDGGTFFGAPAAYWRSLAAYDAPTAFARVVVPVLLLQGGRDYQVTVRDFDVLRASAPAAEHALFPRLNHLFEDVDRDGPDAYTVASHVDAAVIERIAAFATRARTVPTTAH